MSYDPDDPRALFQRVVDDITADIRHGRLQPGDRIPSAQQIVATYGISTMTAQRALQDLRSRGLTHGMPGKGTFVRPDARQKLAPPAEGRRGFTTLSAVGLPATGEPATDERVQAFNAGLQAILSDYAAEADDQDDDTAWEQTQQRLREQLAANPDLIAALAQQHRTEDQAKTKPTRGRRTAKTTSRSPAPAKRTARRKPS